MHHVRFANLALVLLLFMLMACGAEPPSEPVGIEDHPSAALAIAVPLEPAENSPSPMLPSPVQEQILLPTVTPAPAMSQVVEPADSKEPKDWTQIATVRDGRYWLGNPAAPIRLTDYSDFL